MKTLWSLLFLLLLGSCANYVQSLHRQIDYEERMAQQKDRKATPTQNHSAYPGYYQGQYPAQAQGAYAPRDNRYPSRRYDQRPIQNPITLQNVPSAQTNSARRNYADGLSSPQRYTADDLRDNDSSGSLWAEKNGGTYLFTTSENIKRGDFIVIEVLANLKDDIQDELKRAYPEPAKKKDENSEKKEENSTTPVTANTNANADTNKIYDKISTQVVDEVNQNYLFVRGRKEVIFRGAKRYIEIQAVVPRKDIKDTDTVRSDKILQPRIFALRY